MPSQAKHDGLLVFICASLILPNIGFSSSERFYVFQPVRSFEGLEGSEGSAHAGRQVEANLDRITRSELTVLEKSAILLDLIRRIAAAIEATPTPDISLQAYQERMKEIHMLRDNPNEVAQIAWLWVKWEDVDFDTWKAMKIEKTKDLSSASALYQQALKDLISSNSST